MLKTKGQEQSEVTAGLHSVVEIETWRNVIASYISGSYPSLWSSLWFQVSDMSFVMCW